LPIGLNENLAESEDKPEKDEVRTLCGDPDWEYSKRVILREDEPAFVDRMREGGMMNRKGIVQNRQGIFVDEESDDIGNTSIRRHPTRDANISWTRPAG
jgi:ribosomal protein L15E